MTRGRKFDYDVAVIGGGSGGYAAARTAVAEGLKTAVIEGGGEVGGLCILRGCMPSKALLYAAEVRHLVRHAGTWGIEAKSVKVNFRKLMARKNRLIKEFADYRHEQLRSGGFKFIRATAQFADAHSLLLSDGTRLTAKHFIIATGSVIAPPPLPQIEKAGYITSDEALSLKKLPRSLIVLGGGAIACELAQFFARLDVRVTMIQRSETILREYDDDAARVVESAFRREGIRLFTGTKLVDARRRNGRKTVEFEHEGRRVAAEGEEILFALGRRPNVEGLGLERVGIERGGPGVRTNLQQRTNLPHVFAVGDCTGRHEIVHLAVQQGEIAAQNIAHPRRPRRMDYRLLSSVIFTEPQMALVGLTEKAARANGIHFLSASYPFNDHGKSLIMEALDGFVRLLADPETGRILGGCCVGPLGGELIHEIVAAMQKRMTVHELAVMPHYHPTLAEIWTYPAEELAERIPRRSDRRPRPDRG